jgi:hypothetical protein
MKKPLPDRITALKTRKSQLTTRLNTLESKAKIQKRKRDTRCKIIVAGAVIAHVKKDRAFADWLRALLDHSVSRIRDREAIADLLADLLPELAPLKAK